MMQENNKQADFVKKAQKEVDEAKQKDFFYSALHVIVIALNIVLGALTTYLVAVDKSDAQTIATLAFIITILGTFEKTFGFGKKKAGYRDAKTRFQNLIIEVKKLDDGELPKEYWDKLIAIRNLKVELTNDV